MGGLLRAIAGYSGQPTVRAALGLLPILFCRPGELRHAIWEDFDLDKALWHYKPSKGGIPLLTPLPNQAIGLLDHLEALTGPTGYLFPSLHGKGRPMSENTLSAALNRMGFRGIQAAHGFRATARTLLVERLGFDVAWVEMQLGHSVRDANGRAYNRTTYLEQRRQMLQQWADYLDRLRLEMEGMDAASVGA